VFDLGCVNLEHFDTTSLIRQPDLDLSIETTGTQESGIECVGTVGGHDDLDLAELIEAIHLVQQLHQRALDLAIGRRALAEATATNGVDLVHEDDARLVRASVAEHLANQAGALANVLVDDGTRDDLEEVGLDVRSHGASEQRLTGAGRAIQQHSLGRLDADSDEQLGIRQWQLNDLVRHRAA